MELHKFQVHQDRAGARREQQPLPPGLRRVGGVPEQSPYSTGRQHDSCGRQGHGAVRSDRQHAPDAVILDDQAPYFDLLQHGYRGGFPHRLHQGADDLGASAIARGVDDAAARVCRLQPERKRAGRGAIEGGAMPNERGNGVRTGLQNAPGHRRIAQAIAGRQGVLQVQRGVVVSADSRGHATLRPCAGGAGTQRRTGQHKHRQRRQVQRRHQAGEAGADDDGTILNHRTASMRSTASRARAARPGPIVTSWRMSSSAARIFGSVIRFMCGHRLQGRTKSNSG